MEASNRPNRLKGWAMEHLKIYFRNNFQENILKFKVYKDLFRDQESKNKFRVFSFQMISFLDDQSSNMARSKFSSQTNDFEQ